MDLLAEFQRVVSALEAHGIDYALCGGLAVAVHGAPRATRDIDLLVQERDVDAILTAVRPLGFRFQAHPMNFPDGMRIRRVTRIDGRELLTLDLLLVGPATELAWASRSQVTTAGGPVRVISRDALIGMKVAAGRTQDLADVQRLTDVDR